MYGDDQKIVDFEKYCPKCEHYPKSESEDPCWECLDTPTNTWSHKPVNFKEKEGVKSVEVPKQHGGSGKARSR